MVTVTFSRALYLMKHSQLKFKSTLWDDKYYCMVVDKNQFNEGKLVIFETKSDEVFGIQLFTSEEIMGSWVEYQPDFSRKMLAFGERYGSTGARISKVINRSSYE